MSSSDFNNTKKPSFVCLSQIDEDSWSASSQQEHSSTSKKLSKSCEEQNESNEDFNVSNDRYKDSFDEKYGDGWETFSESGNVNSIQSEKQNALKKQ